MMLLALVCCAVLAPIALGEELVRLHPASLQVRNVGEHVEFNCTVLNNQKNDATVLWLKLDYFSNNSTFEPLVPDDRFSVNYDHTTFTFTLRVDKLRINDTGYYKCQYSTDDGEKKYRPSAEVELQIVRPVSLINNATTQYAEGMLSEFDCPIDAFPKPEVYWYRHGSIIRSSTDRIGTTMTDKLYIRNATKEDRGLYQCKVKDGPGDGLLVNLTVQVKSKPVVTAAKLRVGQAVGHSIGLECKVEAYPPPTITWYRYQMVKDGQELKKELIKVIDENDEYVDTLERNRVKSADYGIYVCRAENELGHDQANIELFKVDVPVPYNSTDESNAFKKFLSLFY